jgi:hypothetical protein
VDDPVEGTDMTQRRTRRRPPRERSALVGIGPLADPQDHLNDATPNVERCAWPNCREPLELPMPGGQMSNRYGVLCSAHAVDVAVAVIQHQTHMQRVWNFFEQQTTERAVRAEKWRAEDERYEAEKAALRQDREGFVYYLMVGERLKIGYSVDVKRRMRAYPPGSELLAVEPGDRDLETQRHRQFAGSRTDGREWFRPTPDILDLVEEIVTTYGEPRRFAHHYRRNQQPVQVRRAS